jgi:voltage-gated potassium channel
MEVPTMDIRRIVERDDTPAGRIFAVTVQAAILVSLISFPIQTLPRLSPLVQRVLEAVELVSVILFTVEYVLRLGVARRRWRFVLSPLGLVDLAAILPYWLAAGVDLRSLRAVRLFRFFRILKLVRYSKALRRFHRAFIIAREELVLFGVATLLLLYFSGLGIYYFEKPAQPEAFRSAFDGLWWAVATLTTVGYGDIYPVTTGGRIFTFVVLLVGLGIVAVPSGLLASALSKARAEERTSG